MPGSTGSDSTSGRPSTALFGSGDHGEPPDASRDESRVVNEVSGATQGAVVQAGVVHGGVHIRADTAAISGPVAPKSVIPRQVPAAPGPFVGRAAESAALDRALGPTSAGWSVGADGSAPITVLSGAGGIGKTFLALHWAHRHLEKFPDGQLFVDLRGFSPTEAPMVPGMAVRGFLDAFGIDPGRIPSDLDAQAALYRSLVAGRRMLIVLDNAASAEQVVPLLPGGPMCTVLITTRRTLNALVMRHGARHVDVEVLTEAESRSVLERRLGAERLSREPAAVADLLMACRGFPLALAILAGRAHTDPLLPLDQLAAELRDEGVQALDDDDPTVSLPAVLSTSVRALTTEQRHAFALLGIAPGPDIDLHAASAHLDLSTARTSRVLRALQDASLLVRTRQGRFRMHDLIRAYATTTSSVDITGHLTTAALRRVVDFYLHTTYTAYLLLDRHAPTIPLNPPTPGVRAHPLRAAPHAIAWLETEHTNLMAAQQIAATNEWHDVVWQLAWAMSSFHHRRNHRYDSMTAARAAMQASTRLPDPSVRIRAHRLLGYAHTRLGQYEEATEHGHRALTMAKAHHDPTQQARTHQMLAFVYGHRGDNRAGLAHALAALDHFQALGQPVWEAVSHNGAGWFSAKLGDYDTASAHCRTALELFRRYDNPSGQADTLDSLGYIAHSLSRHEEAITHYHAALPLHREHGNLYAVADTLDKLGDSHAALDHTDHTDHAKAAWAEALEIYRQQARHHEAHRLQRRLSALDPRPDC